ncbi:thiamine pyrophosphate-binding protein [Actinacidiphila acididurans]|uniref:Thiamine pyrophosphate-binding protein n=1 Tax=Actinacidiphila acididurans TaxID=2784346 RepID=A0ABS2TYT5_9ACTN|nr:thiamine pyrophosphate-binding protein [Actinacidiphila acididurans]MBM9507470.1 thiamine pyrophosphate-binding protein [Actinacidiphila acididurans]
MSDFRPARVALFEQLRADGVPFLVGNPGTVEQGFLDEQRNFSDVGYLLTLHEAAAVGIADGYARATRRPGVVQLHSGVGLGNGIGMLYQAMRGHAPLVVLVGEAGLRYEPFEAQMAADLVGMARPVTKWATRVTDPNSTLRVLRRAYKTAATPPYGPVLVVLPADVMDGRTDEPAVPTTVPDTAGRPSAAAIGRAAALLASARRPIVIAGDGVHFSGAQEELGRLATLWGARVWGADWSEVNLAASHPAYAGQLGHMFGAASSAITREADAVLIVGTYVFPEVFPAGAGVFGPGAPVVHIDLDTDAIAKNFPADVGIAADPKQALRALADALLPRMSPGHRSAAAARIAAMTADKRAAERSGRGPAAAPDGTLHASLFGAELARRLPADAILFDEALTMSPDIFRYLPADVPGRWMSTRGGSLGVGIPGAIGAKLARPDATVVGFTGDGGSLYTAQALWTAARYDIGAKFVICNNGSYQLLRDNIRQYWREQGIDEHALPDMFDLTRPRIDFPALSRSLGVPARRVLAASHVGPALDEALSTPGPFLIDLVASAGR